MGNEVNISTGERLMKDILDTIIKGYTVRENFRDERICNPETSHPLEFDRYYPELNLAFEFQGEQHYMPVYGLTMLERQRKLDAIKASRAASLNIRLICLTARDLFFSHIMPRLYKVFKSKKKFRPPPPNIKRPLGARGQQYCQALEKKYPGSKTQRLSAKKIDDWQSEEAIKTLLGWTRWFELLQIQASYPLYSQPGKLGRKLTKERYRAISALIPEKGLRKRTILFLRQQREDVKRKAKRHKKKSSLER